MVLTEFDEEKYKKIIREEGSIEILCILVAKRKLTIKSALEECNLTKEEFLEEMKELGLELPV